MALFVLILLGLSLGWFGSILARTEAAGAILRQMGVGLVAALLAGLLLNGGSILGGLSLWGLGGAIVAACGALALYHALITRAQAASD